MDLPRESVFGRIPPPPESRTALLLAREPQLAVVQERAIDGGLNHGVPKRMP